MIRCLLQGAVQPACSCYVVHTVTRLVAEGFCVVCRCFCSGCHVLRVPSTPSCRTLWPGPVHTCIARTAGLLQPHSANKNTYLALSNLFTHQEPYTRSQPGPALFSLPRSQHDSPKRPRQDTTCFQSHLNKLSFQQGPCRAALQQSHGVAVSSDRSKAWTAQA